MKKQAKQMAHYYYVHKSMTAKAVAKKVGVTEKTIGAWANSLGWKEERVARGLSVNNQLSEIKELISTLTEERKNMASSTDTKEKSRLSDEISKLGKVYSTLQDENKIALHIRIQCMEELFDAMELNDPQLYINSLEFQETYLEKISTL